MVRSFNKFYECEKTMLGVGRVFDDAASPSEDLLVVDVVQRWESLPGDVLGFLDHSLLPFAVQDCADSIPHCDAVAERRSQQHTRRSC